MAVILHDVRHNKEQISDMQVSISDRAIFIHHLGKDISECIVTIVRTDKGWQLMLNKSRVEARGESERNTCFHIK